MKKTIASLFLILSALTVFAQGNELINRPFKEFSSTAFVSYKDFHPSYFITDNNWQILCAFRKPDKIELLDTLAVPYNKSQLRLLETGGLLTCYGDSAKTLMPIFDKRQTESLRQESKAFVRGIYPQLEPKFKQLVGLFDTSGYSAQSYSLVFSWLLDGIIWDGSRLPDPAGMARHPTWSGCYWAMYNERPEEKTGTNSYGPLAVNWLYSLGYWPGDKLIMEVAKEIMAHPDALRLSEPLAAKASLWNICDEKGNIKIPVMRGSESSAVNRLADEITDELSNAVRNKSESLCKELGLPDADDAAVIFYHEVMWDLLSELVKHHVIEKPAILKGEQVGKTHFNEITFITLP